MTASRPDATRPLDLVALAAYMCIYVDGLAGQLAIEHFEGGQSKPTC